MERKEMEVREIRFEASIVSIHGTVDGLPAMWIGCMEQLAQFPVDPKPA